MRISVITPTLNQAQFIETTIKSVLEQNYPDLEYIIIDGGSTDGTIEIIRKYEKYLAYWVREKDAGQSAAINKGFRRATGEIIGWINSDDYYAPNCFWKIVRVFEEDDAVGIVYGDDNIVDEYNRVLDVYSVQGISYKKLLHQKPDVVQPGAFYRRVYLDKVGLLDVSLHYVMDYDLWLKIGRISKIRRIPEIMASFRLHSLSKTTLQRENFLREMLRVKSKYGINKYSWKNKIILYRMMRENGCKFFKKLLRVKSE